MKPLPLHQQIQQKKPGFEAFLVITKLSAACVSGGNQKIEEMIN